MPQALDGRRGRRAAATRPSGAGHGPRRRPDRRRGARAHAGRRADVPVQQPRRAARAAAGRRARTPTVRAIETASTRWLRLGRRARRLRLPHQDAAGAARRAGVRAGLPGRRADAAAPADRSAARCRAGTRWCRPAGGSRSSSLVPASTRPYIGGSQHNSILELVLGYNGLGRLTGDETGSVPAVAARRHRRWHVGRDRLDPDVQRARSAARSSWLLPAALCCWSAGLVAPVAGAARPTGPARRCCCGAAGCWSPGWSSASCRGSSTRTTRSPWRRRSGRWSASAPCCSGAAGHDAGRRCRAGADRRGDRGLGVRAAAPQQPASCPWLAPLVLAVGLLAALAAGGR